MTLILIAAGLMVGLAVAVFGLALCVTAARADEAFDRGKKLKELAELSTSPNNGLDWDAPCPWCGQESNRPGAAGTARGPTEDR